MSDRLLKFLPLTNNTRFGDSFITASRERGYDGSLVSFSLPAGHTCPYADTCLSVADRATGKIQDGENTQYRCYAASGERYPVVRNQRWSNYDILINATSDKPRNIHATTYERLLIEGLEASGITENTRGVVRLHPSGDMFSLAYFTAWLEVAAQHPRSLFYVFTKSLPLWVRLLKERGLGPQNFKIIASIGGQADHLIWEYGLRYARVIDHERDALAEGLTIDRDDTIAAFGSASIGLPILGTQPKHINSRVAGQIELIPL